jgi:hypothetical protein
LRPFVKNSLDLKKGFTLSTLGEDAWLPESFFLFGLDVDQGRPTRMILLVHIPKWTFGDLTGDKSEGSEFVNLPVTLP